MPRNAEPEKSAGLIEEIAAKIQAKIISGTYRPGLRLKQELLAEEFGVSRTPVREALSRLDALGVVRQGVRRSAIVCAPSPRQVREIYQVRAELEGLAAELAAQWISDGQLAGLRAAHDAFVAAATKLRASKQPGAPAGAAETRPLAMEWAETNGQFHSAILDASGNSSLQRILQELANGYFRAIMLSSAAEMTMHRMDANISSHGAILNALERRDPVEARRQMTSHVLQGGAFVSAWFERQNG